MRGFTSADHVALSSPSAVSMSVAAGCAQPRRALVQSPLPVNADGRCEAYPGRGQGQQSEGFKLATRKACSETTSALGLAVQVRCRSERRSVECLQENSGCANPTHRCVQQTDFIRRRAYPSSSRVDNQQCLLQWNRLKRIIMKDKASPEGLALPRSMATHTHRVSRA